MYCRLVEGSVSSDKLTAALEGMKATVLPRLVGIPGFKGAYWFADRDGGTVVAATFYDTRESLEASREMAAGIRTEGMAAGGVEFKRVREMEVVGNTGEEIRRTATHARLTTSKGDPGNLDTAVGVIKDMVIPAVREMPGFRGGSWIIDRESGEGLGATLWESAEAMEATAAQSQELRARAGQAGGFEVTSARNTEITVRAETPVGASA